MCEVLRPLVRLPYSVRKHRVYGAPVCVLRQVNA